MVKTPRSPLLGYNHNVKYGGHIFHVQTEDSGPGNPHLFTHLFFEGSILASKRGQYDPATPEDVVRTMMQAQHKAILRELRQTAFDERINLFFATRGETFRSNEVSVDGPETSVPAAAPEPLTANVNQALPNTEAQVLDLDALPSTPPDPAPASEPLPIPVTKPTIPGPGTYTLSHPARIELVPTAHRPPPIPTNPRPAAAAPPIPIRAITPVIVQRQVVVGGPAATSGRKPSTTPVRRRRVSGGPFVVQEGSHTNFANAVAVPKAETPPHTPATDGAQAPHTADPTKPLEGAPSAFVTDQSLDDVILAYLSQGEEKH
jgi:hypothetical protein